MICIKCESKNVSFDFGGGKISCKSCGYLIEENICNPEISFSSDLKKKNHLNGHIVSSEIAGGNNSFDNSFIFPNIQRKISQISSALRLGKKITAEALETINSIFGKKGIKTKKADIVSVTILYFICRKNKTPHLMIDFSDLAQVSVNKIGIEFLKFTKILNFSPSVVDPSLFVHRFAIKLKVGSRTNKITTSALRLVARMKRDWIVSGRRPSGLCGAALLLSARIHGIKLTAKDVGCVVRIGQNVLKLRLREMNSTSIGNLSRKELNRKGGKDGERESLYEHKINYNFFPPSKKIVEKFIKKEKIFSKKYSAFPNSGKISEPLIKKLLLKNRKPREVPTKTIFGYNKEENNTNSKDKNRKQFNDYIKTNRNEAIVKNRIWLHLNSSFLFSQVVKTRIQKEKPFSKFLG